MPFQVQVKGTYTDTDGNETSGDWRPVDDVLHATAEDADRAFKADGHHDVLHGNHVEPEIPEAPADGSDGPDPIVTVTDPDFRIVQVAALESAPIADEEHAPAP